MKLPRTVDWVDGKVVLIDQRALPEKLTFMNCESVDCVAEAIRKMVVRGAPAIGVAAALGLILSLKEEPSFDNLVRAAEKLKRTRPTAINLFWAIRRVLDRAKSAISSGEDLYHAVEDEALRILEEDEMTNRKIGEVGSELIEDGFTVMTICNAGSFATVRYGTALAPIYVAKERGKNVTVVALETRPVLQGARITAFELGLEGIPVKLIVDGASGYFMREHGVDLVMVGADRILRDGTLYNKIGTYNLAIVSRYHGVPFYTAAPTSTIDMSSGRGDVTIEMRDPSEVVFMAGRRIAPESAEVLNPAFDMTPPDLVTGIITEKGLVRPPFEEGLRSIMR